MFNSKTLIKSRPFRESLKSFFSHPNSLYTRSGYSVEAQNAISQPTHFSHPNLIKPDEVTPYIHQNEYRKRREYLIEKILKSSCSREPQTSKQNIVIIPSASKKYMSDKIPYFFRQNTEFLYLTGCLEPDSCLILTSNCEKYSSTLFVQGSHAHSELWDGPRINPSIVNELFGIDQGLPISELEKFVHLHLISNPGVCIWYDISNPVQHTVHNIMTNLVINSRNNVIDSPVSLLHQLRLIKSPAEIELMRKASEITSKSIIATIQNSKTGSNEHEIFATVDYESRMNGAQYLAFPPVVAGGKRAKIIHYITNNQIVKETEMVLLDTGCEFHGYSSDITRTWPICGKFTKEQKELYEVVLHTQAEVLEMCKKYPCLDSLFDGMCKVLGRNLTEIGLISKKHSNEAIFKAAYNFCPHHVSHYLGMDVHDTPSIKRNIPIEPGMVITVEPGVYINENNHSVPKEFRGIGIRIEDDVLITDKGIEVLSHACPKDTNDIENIASK